VTYSTGAKSGGLNLAAGLPAGAPYTVKPEHVDNYEVGIKNAFYNNRLLINGAAFWMVDHDYQTTAASPVTGVSYLANAKSVISRGFELDVRAMPIPSVTTYASASYDEAFYQSFNNAPIPPYVAPSSGTNYNLTGATVALVPRWSASLGAEYRNRIGTFRSQELIGYIGGDFSWQSSFYSLPDGSPITIVPSYGILNLHAGITEPSGRWDLSFWIHNALNAQYITQNQIQVINATGAYGAQVGDPLMFGVTLRAKI
jgi:iron complex outermembrane receptor protein